MNVQPVGVAEFGDTAARTGEVQTAGAAGRFGAEDDVLQHRQIVGQHEVLVHHADPGGESVTRRAEVHLVAADEDAPLVGGQHAVDHVHERGLAGAVLAADGVDLSLGNRQAHPVVGKDAGKRFVMSSRARAGVVTRRAVLLRLVAA